MSRTNDELSIASFHESDHSDMEEQQDDSIREEFQHGSRFPSQQQQETRSLQRNNNVQEGDDERNKDESSSSSTIDPNLSIKDCKHSSFS